MNSRRTATRIPVNDGGAVRSWWNSVRLPGRWTPALLLVVAALSLLSLLDRFLQSTLQLDLPGLGSLERWFYVDREAGVPAWFSSVLLLLCAQQLWRIATVARAQGDRWHRHWRLLAVAFGYLSLDELIAAHEMTIGPLRAVLGADGWLSFAWVILAVPLVAAFGLFFLRFLRDLPARTRWAFLVPAALYLGGALGLEMVGSKVYSEGAVDTLVYGLVAGVEEALEMVGTVLFLGATTVVLRERTYTLPLLYASPTGRHAADPARSVPPSAA